MGVSSQVPYGPDSPLHWGNYVVAQAAQAALGLVDKRIKAVGCRVTEEAIELHFAVPAPSPSVDEDIDDICFELDVLLGGKYLIVPKLHVGTSRLDWSDSSLRGIYSAKSLED
jgi:hypothetical protein